MSGNTLPDRRQAFVLPFWVGLSASRREDTTSQMADIVITMSGILHAVLHMLMRTNSERFAIRSRRTIWTTKRKIRIFGPNDLNIARVISTPLLSQPTESQWGSSGCEKDTLRRSSEFSSNSTSPRPKDVGTALSVPPRNIEFTPMIPQTPNMRQAQAKSTYSFFPSQHDPRQNHRSWVSDDSAASIEIQVPSPLFSKSHRREDSVETSATVEIGMRFSNPPPDYYKPARAYPSPLQTIYLPKTGEVESPVAPGNPQIVILPEQQPSGPSTPDRLRNSFAKSSKALKPKLGSLTSSKQQRKQETMKSLPPVPPTSEIPALPKKAIVSSPRQEQTRTPSPALAVLPATVHPSPRLVASSGEALRRAS